MSYRRSPYRAKKAFERRVERELRRLEESGDSPEIVRELWRLLEEVRTEGALGWERKVEDWPNTLDKLLA